MREHLFTSFNLPFVPAPHFFHLHGILSKLKFYDLCGYFVPVYKIHIDKISSVFDDLP